MPCTTTSVSLIYDIHGDQTGEFEFECGGKCEEHEGPKKRCDWAQYFSHDPEEPIVICCACVSVFDGGKVERITQSKPAGKLTHCEDSIALRVKTSKKGDQEVRELEPFCRGGCDDAKFTCTREVKEDWQILEEPGRRPRMVQVKKYTCVCKIA